MRTSNFPLSLGDLFVYGRARFPITDLFSSPKSTLAYTSKKNRHKRARAHTINGQHERSRASSPLRTHVCDRARMSPIRMAARSVVGQVEQFPLHRSKISANFARGAKVGSFDYPRSIARKTGCAASSVAPKGSRIRVAIQ